MTIPACLEKFNPGTIVTIATTAESYEHGPAGTEYENYEWNADWADTMTNFVGKTFKVKGCSITQSGIGVSCLEIFEGNQGRSWNFPPWCLALQDEEAKGLSSGREFEKSELDLIEKFVKYQADEKKKKILAEMTRKECALMSTATSISRKLIATVDDYWTTKLIDLSSDKNRYLIDYCKRIEDLFAENLPSIKEKSGEVRKAIEVGMNDTKGFEKEIKVEVLSILTKFVNSDIYQSTVPGSKTEDVILRVVTDPIILEHKKDKKAYKEDFGPMEIHFSMMAQTIKVIPQKPNYDEFSSSKFFHPHVARNGNVCEGAGKIPITNAIKDSRFTDLFDIIIGILENYNPGSPYCALELWHPPRTKCSNCGELRLESDLYACTTCHKRLCSECINYCYYCSNYFCPSHVNHCSICKHGYCNSTRCKDTHKTCVECNQIICTSNQPYVDKKPVGGPTVSAHTYCCIQDFAGNWHRKSQCIECPDCGTNKVKDIETSTCQICGKEICRDCLGMQQGHCKECNEKIKQEEIEAARVAEERRAVEERLAQTTEETRAEGTSTVEEATVRSEEQEEEDVSTGN